MLTHIYLNFFFQAEDGIRDHCVTGVQTCALPILGVPPGDPEDQLPGGSQWPEPAEGCPAKQPVLSIYLGAAALTEESAAGLRAVAYYLDLRSSSLLG